MLTEKSTLQFRYLDIIIALFVCVLITSNIASCAKIIDLKISIMGIQLAFDGGTLLFPLAYVTGDILTEVYGFKTARRVIWIGFMALAIASFFFLLLRVLPGEEVWESYAGQESYEVILGGMSTGGIALASFMAYLAGSFSNSVILSRMKVLTKGRFLWMRTIGSSIIGHLLDSFIFIGIAVLTGIFPAELFTTLVLTNCILKLSFEILMTPFCYFFAWALKKAEKVDTYDTEVKYNPFRLR